MTYNVFGGTLNLALSIYVLFYCHCAVSFFKCYSVNMCNCYV